MRVSADVYDESENKLSGGPVTAIQSASITQQLDGAGSFSLNLVTDERVLSTLVNEAEVRLQVQTTDDDPASEWVRGIIRDNDIADGEGGTTIGVSGPDTIHALTERTVGIGRSYNNQTIQTIINALVALVPNWSASVDSTIASDLQTVRFDGANILQCLIRMVEEKGCHFRNGLAPNTLEFGEFGDLATAPDGRIVHAIAPPDVVSNELQENQAIILIDKISQSNKSSDVINWCIPIGAGEGSAALTLRDTTYTIYKEDGTIYRAGTASRYPIYRRTNANNIVEYYVDASGGARLRQATVSFKQIGPVVNSLIAKQLAANALAEATFAYLDRQKVLLVSYKLSAKNVKANIRPGDKIMVTYQGRIEIYDETRSKSPRLTYLDVNEPLWVMKVSKRVSGDQITHDYEVSTIDRYKMDESRIVVSMMEAVQARNVSVQTFPQVIPFMAYDTMKEGTTFGTGYSQGKKARLDLRINSYITDIQRVELRFITYPLHTTSKLYFFSSPNFYSDFDLITSSQYPSGISVFVNSVDVTSQVSDIDTAAVGPFNAGSNTQTDNRIDISDFILNAAGGIYRNHIIELHCEARLGGDVGFGSPDPAVTNQPCSQGVVFMVAYVFGSVRP